MKNYIDRNGKRLSYEVCTAYGDYEARIKTLQSKLDKAVEALESVVIASSKPKDLHSYHDIWSKALYKCRETLKQIKEGD